MNHMKRSLDIETRLSIHSVLDLEKRNCCIVLSSNMTTTKTVVRVYASGNFYLAMLAGASCSVSPVMGVSTRSL